MMNPSTYREELRCLADDWAWLERYCREQPELAASAAYLRMAAALTRNVIGPALEHPEQTKPLFLCVVGGAGAGKSTVINFLAGAVVAEANPQAGYTRHPTAYIPAQGYTTWPSTLGFLGPLVRLTEPKPANLDEDVYQVRRIPAPLQGKDPLQDFVLWDCPDMTTWAADAERGGYVSRLMEVVGLADVVVYVASDERYNDEIPTQFLHHVIQAGKAVVVCITKMRESDAPAMIEHFRREVLGKLPQFPGGIDSIPCIAFPQIPPEVRRDPTGKGMPYRVALINQLLVAAPTCELTRSTTVQNAMRYLETASDQLLDVAKRDLEELERWRDLVNQGRNEFEQRYQREFFSGETFRRFDRTRDQVLEYLELPGPLRPLSTALAMIRWPYRMLKDLLIKLIARPEMPALSEQAVCQAAMGAWLDGLQAEALRRGNNHTSWKQIVQSFDRGLKNELHDHFFSTFRSFALRESDELNQAANALPNYLVANPILLSIARLIVFGFDLGILMVVIYLAYPPSWWWLVLVPLSLSLSRQVTEAIIGKLVEFSKNRVRDRRMALVRESLSGPLCAKLAEVPVRGGTTLEKLSSVLKRIPETIQALAVELRTKQSALTTNPVTIAGSPT